MKTVVRSALLVAVLISSAACSKSRDDASATKLTSATTGATGASAMAGGETAPLKRFVPSHAAPPFAGRFPHVNDPAVDVAERIVSIQLVRKGDDPAASPVFTLTNLTKKRVAVRQTWVFYYDGQKKYLSAYPHALGGLELAPGETKEEPLGERLQKLAKETVFLEGEVSRATVDGTDWENPNLVPLSGGRPQGGFTAQQLADMAGERVIVDVYDLTSKKVRLTNVTDRTVTSVDVRMMVANDKKDLDASMMKTVSPPGGIAPGQSIDVTLVPYHEDKPKPGLVRVVAFAHEVKFADGPPFRSYTLFEQRLWRGLAAK